MICIVYRSEQCSENTILRSIQKQNPKKIKIKKTKKQI